MTYAIIEASGKQFRVEPGRFYDLDRLPVDADANVIIDQVLFISHDGESMVGQPLVEGATVSGTVVSHLRGRKIIVYKMKPKKKTRKKRGHRQELTRLMIDSITVNGTVLAQSETATTAPEVQDYAPEPVEPSVAPVDEVAPAAEVQDSVPETVEPTAAPVDSETATSATTIQEVVSESVEPTVAPADEVAPAATEEE